MDDDLVDIADHLHSLAVHLLRFVRNEDPKMEITPAQASALSVIVFGGPISMRRLAEIEQVRSPTMTRLVDHLVKAGLVERTETKDDGRKTLVASTPRGRDVMKQGRGRRVATLAKRLELVPSHQLAQLRLAIETLERTLESSEGPA